MIFGIVAVFVFTIVAGLATVDLGFRVLDLLKARLGA